MAFVESYEDVNSLALTGMLQDFLDLLFTF